MPEEVHTCQEVLRGFSRSSDHPEVRWVRDLDEKSPFRSSAVHWRFSISSDSAPLIAGTAGDPHWIRINIRELSRLVIARVDG